jgi:hypothetical protein
VAYAYGEFRATASMPKWPCGLGKTCTVGSISGTFTGVIEGTQVSLPINSVFFSYVEPDTVPAGCFLFGGGSTELSVGSHDVFMSFDHAGPIGTGDIQFDGHLGVANFAYVIHGTGFCQPLQPGAATATIAGVLRTTT